MANLVSTDRTPSFLNLSPHSDQVMGRVIWMQKGLHGLTLRLRVGNTLNLKVRNDPQSMETASYRLGQWLVVNIPQESMYLLSPGVPLPKKRWTRWEGRIVLSARPENDSGVPGPTTIKVCGEQVTLHVNRILGGKSVPRQVGDHVRIMIDPRAIRIVSPVPKTKSASPELSSVPVPSGKVRLHGTIRRTKPTNSGIFVTLQVGHAVVSAYVNGETAHADFWPVGGRISLLVGECEAWVQSCGMPIPPQSCFLVYLDGEEESSRMPISVPSMSEKSLSRLIEYGG